MQAGRIAELRREAAEACRAVYAHLGLADFTDEHVELAVVAAGLKDLGETDTLAVLGAAQAIRQRGLTVVDIVAALHVTRHHFWAIAPGTGRSVSPRRASAASTSGTSPR